MSIMLSMAFLSLLIFKVADKNCALTLLVGQQKEHQADKKLNDEAVRHGYLSGPRCK